jgi:hypothetical protein
MTPWTGDQLVARPLPTQRKTIRNIEFSDSIHRPGIKKQTKGTRRFGNWICFRPQVRENNPTLLGPLERASPNHWLS